MLSVIIITKNEAHNIQDCLESVAWADEIIVVDSGSSDGTQAICGTYPHCRLIETDWPGFGPQKNRALQAATHEWVLSIDADERVSAALRNELEHAMQLDSFNGFYLPRKSQYCGRFMNHSGWYPDFVLRLFKRQQAQFSNDEVHEQVIVQGPHKYLNEPLQHYSFANLEQVLHKMNQYSTLGAEQLYKRGKQATITKAVGKGLWAFIRTYILRKGFLDGQEGLMLAISNAEGTYYKYAKLSLLCQQKRTADEA